MGALRRCFARTETWQQAGSTCLRWSASCRERNGWTIAEHAGDRTPDRTQRLLNRASWDALGGDERGPPVRGGRAWRKPRAAAAGGAGW